MGPAPSTIKPTPVDYHGLYDSTLITDLKKKEHELFDAQNKKTSNMGYAGGYVTGLIFDAINKPNVDRFNNLIDSDPVRAWGSLRNIGATDTDDWQGVLRGTTHTTGTFDNALTNTFSSIGGTVKNTVNVVSNVAKNAENLSGFFDDITNPKNITLWLIGGGAVVAFLVLRK